MASNILAYVNRILFFLCLLCVIFSPLNTKMAGVAWFLILLMGIFNPPNSRCSSSPLQSVALQGGQIHAAAKLWLFATGISLLLFVLMTAYWQDAWSALHVQLRLFLSALAVWQLTRVFNFSKTHAKHFGQNISGRDAAVERTGMYSPRVWRSGLAWVSMMSHHVQRYAILNAITLACATAFWLTWFHGNKTPTNPIPWAIGVSFLPCFLLPYTCDDREKISWRCFWGLGVLLGVSAVLLSLTRGAYGLVLWVLMFCLIAMVKKIQLNKKNSLVSLSVFFGLVFAVLLVPQIWQNPISKLEKGWQEVSLFSRADSTEQAINSSVGVRLYFWPLAFSAIEKAPILGMSRAERKQFIHDKGVALNSPVLSRLDHFHNDYLTYWVDDGVIGLAALLILLIGLGVVIYQFSQWNSFAAWQLAGVLFMASTGSLTNANFSHNYYGVMWALVISLIFLTAKTDVSRDEKIL